MGQWADRINNHAARAKVESIHARFEELTNERPGDEELIRSAHLVGILVARLQALDPYLARESFLADVEKAVSALDTRVSQYLDPPEGQESTSPEVVTSAADRLAELLAAIPPAGDAELVAVTDEFRAQLTGLEARVQAIKEEAGESVTASTAAHAATLDERKAEAAQLEVRLTEADTAVSELRTKVGEFIAERSAEATAAAETVKTRHDKQHQLAESKLKEVVGEAAQNLEAEEKRQQEAHADLIKQQQDAGGQHLARIEELKAQAELLVGAVGRTGLSGGFQQWEGTERKQAGMMRITAITLGIAAAVVVLALVGVRVWWAEDHDNTDLPLTVAALAVPAALGAVAAYAGKESSRHRRNQVIARRTEIELASFAPFLAELDSDKQAELTAMFAPVFFGQATAHMGSDRKEAGENAPESLIREVFKQIAARVPEWFKKSPTDAS